jgi:CRP-like cAMP-binding protein
MQVNYPLLASGIICAMQHAFRTKEGNGHGGASRDPRLLEGVLSNVELFRGIAPRPLADLAARARALHFRRGMTVCPRGRAQAGLHAVAYGQVKLALRGADGDERVLRVVGPGDTFGLAVSILGQPLPYDAVALNDAFVVMIPGGTIAGLLENDPRFTRTVIRELAERAVMLLAEVESGALHRGVQRLATYLGKLAETANGNGSCVVSLPTTKTVVAARLGVKKETLSRMFRELTEQGLIEVEQRQISILDRARLAAMARQATA